MPDLDSTRRARTTLERKSTTLDARLAAEEAAIARANRSGDRQEAAEAKRRLAELRAEKLAAARELREAEARLEAERAAALAAATASDLLGTIDPDVPLLLLPIRLETRFHGAPPARQLLVRVYPDDLHVDTHEPALTPEEIASGRRYWQQIWSANEEIDEAEWNVLASEFGAERAAWVARTLTPENLSQRPAGEPAFPEVDERPAFWSRAPRTTVLPDRWLALGYVGTTRVFAVHGEPIPEILQVGPSPDVTDEPPADTTTLPLDEGMRWLVDFESALKVGMAFRIGLPANAQEGLTRLLVLGVKSSLGTSETAAAIAAQLEAQHYTRGVAFIPPGTPTNNTSEAASGLDTRDRGHERSFAAERRGPLFTTKSAADALSAARALGVEPAIFQQVAHAEESHLRSARAMNATLWPATLGYYLEQRLAGVMSDTELAAFRRHFIDFVRSGGPLPSLRIGRQPYGILPVTSMDRWHPADADDLDVKSLGALQGLRQTFRRAVGQVPRVGVNANVDQNLVAVLRMCAVSKGHHVRHVLGPMFVSNFFAFAGSPLVQNWWAAHRAVAHSTVIAGITPETPQSFASLAPTTDPLSKAPRVKGDATPDYLAPLAAANYRAVRQHELVPEPRPMLYLLARHSLLLSYATAANRIARRGGLLTGTADLDAEFMGIDPAANAETIWQRLDKPVPTITGPQKLGDFLDDRRRERDADARELAEMRAALRELAPVATPHLERLLAETLDLASHRFDAWATSLATRRLDWLRTSKPAGLRLGGFGWLEEVRPTGSAVSNGFVQVPSLEHAATVAVLASGYLSHRNDSGPSPFEIDLSSDRVRTARWLLEGVRAGQSLGALLGHRIERALHDARLAPHLDTVRDAYPLLPSIDGLALLDDRRTGTGKYPALRAALQRELATNFPRIETVFSAVEQELDALGDLLIAEGVFQATRGSFDRAGQTLGAVVQGQSLPETEVMDTPRTGVLLTHRIIALFAGKPAGAVASPRALAEPRLNAWAATWLGDLSRVRARVEYVDTEHTVTREVRLSELEQAPIDLLGNSEENLNALLLAHAAAKRPAAMPATAAVRLLHEPDPQWPSDVLGWRAFLLLVAAVRTLMTAARPLASTDLAPADQPLAASIDLGELGKRANAAVAALTSASEGADADEALRAFGIFSATAESAKATAAERLGQIKTLEAAFTRDDAGEAGQMAHDTERIRLVFGKTFPVLPLFKLTESTELARAFDASDALQGGNPLEAAHWLDRVGRVRASAGKLAEASRLAAVLHGSEPAATVAQIPFAKGDRWVALPAAPGSIPAGKVSLVASGAVPDAGGAMAGLVLDEWTELVPSARETTGLVFQFDRPAARPPQAMLLAVAPDPTKPWDLATLEATLLETLELAQLRLVDQDALLELDHYLPALSFALNSADETVSTDFR